MDAQPHYVLVLPRWLLNDHTPDELQQICDEVLGPGIELLWPDPLPTGKAPTYSES